MSRTASATSSRGVATSPPSPAARFFVAYSEKHVASERAPSLRTRYLLSSAWAASSTTGSPSAWIASRSQGWPARWTGRIAFVRSVTSGASRTASRFRSSSRTSQNTGVAPVCSITFAVAGQVIGDVITSSPGPTPTARSARCIAAVPELTASTCGTSRYSARRSSRSAARGPVVSHPERSVSATAAISSSPIAGGWKPSGVSRRVRIDPEAYGVRRTASPLERLVAARARREHRAGAVGPRAQGAEDVPRPSVDAHPPHPLDRLCVVHSLDRDERPDRGDEEDDGRRPAGEAPAVHL